MRNAYHHHHHVISAVYVSRTYAAARGGLAGCVTWREAMRSAEAAIVSPRAPPKRRVIGWRKGVRAARLQRVR